MALQEHIPPPEKPAGPESPRASLDALKTDVTDGAKNKLKQQFGIDLTGIETAQDKFDRLSDAAAELGKKLEGAWDRIKDILQPIALALGIAPEEFDAPASLEYSPGISTKKTEREAVERWGTLIGNAAAQYGVPKSLILSIMKHESGFDENAQPLDKNGRPRSSSLGLSQAINGTWKRFCVAADGGPANADRRNPEHAIRFIGWYVKNLISEVGRSVEQNPAYAGYELSLENLKWIYMAYHEGAQGYLRLRKYMDTGDANGLLWWQKRKNHAPGIGAYADRVASTASNYEKQKIV